MCQIFGMVSRSLCSENLESEAESHELYLTLSETTVQ